MVRRAGRSDFTESDDDHLVKHIAEIKPGISGRMGNNLYILLEKSADLRPWSQRHPWQSWRERYKKNQDWFNFQIRRYQKKLREAPQATDKKPEPEPEHKAVQSSSSSESEDETESEAEGAGETRDQEELYRELFGSSQFSGDETLDAQSSTHPPQRIHNKPKRKILRQDDDSNFFGTPSPSSPPAATPTPQGKPPILLEGPYRSLLKRPRATSDNITNEESWPPKRRKKDIDVISPDVEMSDLGNARSKAEAKKTVPVTLSATGSANGLSRLRPPAQVNAIASSSKVLLRDPHHQHPKPTNLLKMIYAKRTPSSDTSHKNNSRTNNLIQTVANNAPKSEPIDVALLPKNTKSSLIIDKKKHNGHTPNSSSRNSLPIEPMRRLIATPNDAATVFHPTRISPVSADDSFIANKPLDKGKSCASSPVIIHDQPPRRIDLRQSLNSRARHRSSDRSSRTSRSSTSRHSVTPFLLPEDQEIVNQVGFPQIMAVIAKHYGFDVDVAMNAFFATKSIEKTKSVLQHAKEVANSATSVLLAELAKDINPCDDEELQNTRRGRTSPIGDGQNSSSGYQKAKQSSGSRKAKRPSLNIKPQPFDEEIDQSALSDYSPPHVSRAGQFMRLVKQGRRAEAVDRERRRASGAIVAQTQAQSCDEDQRQKSLSVMPNSPPTFNSGMDIDSYDDDGFQSPIAAPQEDNIQHQPLDDTSSPVDHHRIFFKRISEGQSTLNEDEDDPAVFKLAQAHRDLVMDVTEENADALRSFEQKNNQDLLRLWSLDWARQKIADM